MDLFQESRKRQALSQRLLARRAGISYKSVQLLESGRDTRLSTLQKVAVGLGYPEASLRCFLDLYFSLPQHALYFCSLKILRDGEASWRIHLFDFVDAFRKNPAMDLISHPPDVRSTQRTRELLAAVVETLCWQWDVETPAWCAASFPLPEPWFVAGVEALKTIALVESPLHFRRRGIFVLGNFLARL